MSRTVEIIIGVLAVLSYLVAPLTLVWGWVRWTRQSKQRNVLAILSLLGFSLASGSALLAGGAIAYAQLIRGFGFYDPQLMRIMGIGIVLSLGGLVFGLSGIWKENPLSWHAPVLSVSSLAFWLLEAAMQ